MDNVITKVEEARELFEIEEFPGNFFELMPFVRYLEKHNILIFKESIGQLSGFIGYDQNDLTVICVNYVRSIGHQNFTFAHELGHWMLHKGVSYSDDNKQLVYSTDKVEREANYFASELLYPKRQLKQDYAVVCKKDLLIKKNRKELAEFVNELALRYCMSFNAVLYKILYEANLGKSKKKIRFEIDEALGMKISKYFDKDFYMVNYDLKEYQKLEEPYVFMREMIDYLVLKNELGLATAESIKLRNGIKF